MTPAHQFLLKCSALLLPFVVPLAFPVFVLWGAGEFVSEEEVLRRQGTEKTGVVTGLAFSNPWRTFKLNAARHRKSETLILGSSRAMPLRSVWFKHPSQIYNACMGVSVLWHHEEFLRRLPQNSLPKLLILDLDQWDLNKNSSTIDSNARVDPFQHTAQEPLRLIQERWMEIYRMHSEDRLEIGAIVQNIFDNRYIGLTAVTQRAGFRNDGSRVDPAMFNTAHPAPGVHDPEYSDAMSRIAAGAMPGSSRYEHGCEVSAERMATLRSLLAFCKDRGIHVAAFMPPFAHKLVEVMRSMGDAYAYFFQLDDKLQPLFREHGFTLVDASDIRSLGFDDVEVCYSDGYHSSEKVYLRILIELARADSEVRVRVDLPVLEALLKSALAPLIVPE
jgi:hypothetical protein